MKPKILSIAVSATLAGAVTQAQALELFVDTKTQQVFTAPGKNRVRLGEFKKVDEAVPEGSAETKALTERLDQKKAELEAIESRLDKKQASLKAAEAKAEKAKPAEKPEKDAAHVTLGEKGLEIKSNDGNFAAKIGGRLQVDSQINWNDPKAPATTALSNGVGFRRARIFLDGTVFKDYDYRFEYDFARGNGTIAGGITDAFVRYVHFKPFSLIIGQQNEGKSLESTMSNNYMTFIERALPNNALIESNILNKYQLGIAAENYDKVYGMPYFLRGGLLTEALGGNAGKNGVNDTSTNLNGNGNRNNFSGNTSYQLMGRGALMPFKDNSGNFLHTAAWGSWRSLNNTYNADGTLRIGGWQFASQPDTNVDRSNWINTGILTNTVTKKGKTTLLHEADNIAMFGAELAGVAGPAHFAAEYMQAKVAGKGYSNDDILAGYYAQVGYFLTGESRSWDEKRAAWGRLTPKNNFDWNGGSGAVEIAARYDLMDMNSKNINGGSMNAGTLGINWYFNSHVRLMTNWVHVFNVSTHSAGACTKASSTQAGNAVQISGASIGCFNGLSPNIWETALRMDF